MGVRGLTTFVENNQRKLLEREKLHNCSLVIDGFGLLYNLYFGSNLDSRHGGEFAAFAELINKFFKQLLSCNIKPYVIFDGPIEPDKLPCVLSRLQDTIRNVSDLVKYEENSQAKIMPLFAVDTLIHYLSTHQIPFAVSLVEADSEIVAVANALDCPVLSVDSDYYIYNVRRGYIQFQHLEWENPWWDKGRKSIACLKYKVSNMTREYGISERNLPYLSILLGNDWIQRETFSDLTSRLPQARAAQRQKRRRQDNRIDTVIWWLSTKTNENSLLEKLRYSLPKSKKDEIMEKVTNCLDLYRNVCDATETLKILKGDFDQQPGIEKDIEHLVRTSSAHPITMNILNSKYACMPVIMSDPRLPSPHSCATEIRTLFYRVLLRNHRFKTAGSEFLFLQEYDNVERMYKKSKTISIMTSLCPMCDTNHEFEEECNTPSSGDDVKSVFMILKLLKLADNNFFSEFLRKNEKFTFSQKFLRILDLVMAATLFWVKKTPPKPVFICALFLMISWSIWNRKSQDLPVQTKTLSPKKTLDVKKSENFDKKKTNTQLQATQSKTKEKLLLVEKTQISELKEDLNNTEDCVVDILEQILVKVENLGEINPDTSVTKTSLIRTSATQGGDEEQLQQKVQEMQTSTKDSSMDFQESLLPTSSTELSIQDCTGENEINSSETQGGDDEQIKQGLLEEKMQDKHTGKKDESMDSQEPLMSSPQVFIEAKKDENLLKTKSLQKKTDKNTKNSSQRRNSQELELLNQASPKQKIIKLDAHENSSAVKQENFRSQKNTKMEPEKKTSQIPVVNTALEDKKKANTPQDDFFNKKSTQETLKNPQKRRTVSATYFLNQLDSMTIKTASGKVEHVRREFDIDFLHGISEWLCILNAALLLHHMVEGQRSSFAIQDFLTSNILLHEIHARIARLLKTQENMQSDIKSISDLISGRLQSLPEVQTSFRIFINFLLQH